MNETAKVVIVNEKLFMLEVYVDPFNRRVRIDDYRGNLSLLLKRAELIAMEYGVEKLIFKARDEHFRNLLENGFVLEGTIDHYFLGSTAYFFCKYFSVDRRKNDHWITEDQMIHSIAQLTKTETIQYPSSYKLLKADKTFSAELAQLYRTVFPVYPTPLHDEDYVSKTMDEGTIYYVFSHSNQIVSAASAEVNQFYRNAELTDCATLNEHRKHGLMKFILTQLEDELRAQGIFCAYSIARALSFGMNASLFQLGYSYSGRLLNNCLIYDKLENMNIWVKDLS